MFQPYSYVIVDFSKNNPFPPTTEFLKVIQSAAGVDPSRLIVVARNNQRAELQAAIATVRVVKWVDDFSQFQLGLPVLVVKQELASLLQLGRREAILVTSYNGAVLGEIQRLGNPDVEVQSLSKYRPGFVQPGSRAMVPSQFLVDATSFTQLAPPSVVPYWRFDGFIPRTEAQALLVRGLRRAGAIDRRHAVSQPNLKRPMGEIDHRFVGSGSTNGTSGLMGILAASSHADGLLDAAASYNGTPYYWLTARALQELTVSSGVESAQPVVYEPVSSVTPAAPDPVGSSTASVDVRVECHAPGAAVARPARERSPHKSQRMQDALIESGWGPRTKPRIATLDQIGEILAKRQGNTLSDILGDARDNMIQGVADGPEKQAAVAAIGAVRKMLREFLPASKALKDPNKNPLPTGFRAGPTLVADFDPDWRMRTEAQLLLKLVEVFPEPIDAEHDVENIIGAIYHVRNGPHRRELKRQVEAMIGYLLDEHLIREDAQNGRQILVFGQPIVVNSPVEPSQLRIAHGS